MKTIRGGRPLQTDLGYRALGIDLLFDSKRRAAHLRLAHQSRMPGMGIGSKDSQ